MTVDETTATPAPSGIEEVLLSSGGFPTGNLLPRTIVTRRLLRAAKRRALFAVLIVLALMALLFVYVSIEQRNADAAKAEAQARVDAATVAKQRYAYVPAVYQAVTTARQDLATAMGQEVQVSRLMGGLSAMQPPGLSLSTLDASVGPGSEENLSSAQEVIPGVGTVAFEGESASVDLVAAWLDRVRENADYEAPVLDDVVKSTEGIYTFTASAALTDQALSGRYVQEEG